MLNVKYFNIEDDASYKVDKLSLKINIEEAVSLHKGISTIPSEMRRANIVFYDLEVKTTLGDFTFFLF